MDERAPAAPPSSAGGVAAEEYLRRHRDVYTPEILEARLREAGHEPAAIAAAWASFATGEEISRSSGPGLAATLLAVLGGLVAIVVFGGSAALAFLGSSMSAVEPSRTGVVLAVYGLAAIAGGIATLLLLRRGRRAEHAVLAVFGAIGVATLVWLAISGLCLATWEGLNL